MEALSKMEADQKKTHPVGSFVQSVAHRLNRHRLWHALIWAGLLSGAVMLVIALCYVWPGYRVPTIWYAIVPSVALFSAGVVWFVGRKSTDQAAHYADSFFKLKDSIGSCVSFSDEGHAGGFYDLQADQTQALVKQTSVDKIAFKPPYRIIAIGALLILVSVSLGFKSPSAAVVAEREQQAATSQMTAAANEELKELVEELEESLGDEEEKKLVDPDKLRKWVDELRETTDPKEAMRQYARLEMKLNRAAEALKQRQDEKLLNSVADELKKDETSKALGEKLKQKKYELAAKELKDLKPSKIDPEKLKELSEKRKELAKLKAMANRMADAARNTRSAKNQKNGNSKNSKSGKPSDAKMANSKNGKTSKSGSEMEGDPSDAAQNELAQLLEELEESVEELDQEMEELELADLEEMDEQDLEKCEDCQECEAATRAKLDELGDKLRRMAKKRSAQAKLKQLSQRCSECQSAGTMLVQTKRKGGKKAGEGSVDSTRDTQDEFKNNDQYTKLKGIKGKGPSLTKIESADDGTGTSQLAYEAKKREFKRQFESFVGREDVPEDLKNGVKNYFTNIHETGESSDATGSADAEDD